jgi:hypothetical protein
MVDNWYLAWELTSARQKELLAWAKAERAAQSARRAHRQTIRPPVEPVLRAAKSAETDEPPQPCCEGGIIRRSA